MKNPKVNINRPEQEVPNYIQEPRGQSNDNFYPNSRPVNADGYSRFMKNQAQDQAYEVQKGQPTFEFDPFYIENTLCLENTMKYKVPQSYY